MRLSEVEIRNTKYWALEFGYGEGCDYTIACNQRITPLKAETLTEAVEEGRQIVREFNSCERRHDEIVIIKANGVAILGVSQILRDMKAKKSADEASKNEQAERKELERLSKKYS